MRRNLGRPLGLGLLRWPIEGELEERRKRPLEGFMRLRLRRL